MRSCIAPVLRRFRRPGVRVSLAPAAAVLLLAVSPFCYAFTRIAVLEPLLVLLMLRARAGRDGQRGVRSPDGV